MVCNRTADYDQFMIMTSHSGAYDKDLRANLDKVGRGSPTLQVYITTVFPPLDCNNLYWTKISKRTKL